MKTVCGVLLCYQLVIASVLALDQVQLVEEWLQWKNQHKKGYRTKGEERKRHSVWLANREFVSSHNSQWEEHGYSLSLNQFADLTDEEYTGLLVGHSYPDYEDNPLVTTFSSGRDLTSHDFPNSIDWRTKGVVTSVKNQNSRQCNSSYAFAAVGSVEGAWALARGSLTRLSEQNIIDCSVPYGNMGCRGGSVFSSYLYMVNSGVSTYSCYPYRGRQSYCSYTSNCTCAKMSGMVRIEFANETDLQAALATVGPVAVTIDGSSKAFRFYSQGVFDWSGCSSTKLNHPLLLIGYGYTYVENVYTEYWLLKNSFGTNWGEDGYFRLIRNQFNQCGIASDALFPTL